jgi:ABC-2 type transport system permease protein
MGNRLFSLVVKELLQFVRDRLILPVTLIAPALELILIGGGVGDAAAAIPVAVIDNDITEVSREVITALDNTQELDIAFYPHTLDEARDLIDAGAAAVLVMIPEGFADDLRSGEAAQVQLVLDGSNVVVAGDAQGAAQGAIETLGWDIVLAGAPGGLAPRGVDLRHEALYNRALDGKPYDLTATLALILCEVAIIASVMSLVREREAGTLEQVAITPIKQIEMILGKGISPLIVGMLNFIILFGVVRLVFGLPLRGSAVLLTGMTLLYLVSEICVALMISAIAQTQQQAITMAFIWLMLAITMSGYLVPTTRLPIVLRLASNALPLQHYMEIVRDIMLKGAGLAALWPHLVALLVLDVVVVGVTVFMLKRLGR